MRCPFCGSTESKVVDSRDSDDSVRRRRQCLSSTCAERFSTAERVVEVTPQIVKGDGRRESFSRSKLLRSVADACKKRPVSDDKLERLANSIEAVLYERGELEVPSRAVRRLVMDRLRELDAAAYVRYATAYDEYASIAAMQAELASLAAGTARVQAQLPLISDAAMRDMSASARRERTRRRRPVRQPRVPVPLRAEEDEASASRRRARRGSGS